jgi:hypothetical protein
MFPVLARFRQTESQRVALLIVNSHRDVRLACRNDWLCATNRVFSSMHVGYPHARESRCASRYATLPPICPEKVQANSHHRWALALLVIQKHVAAEGKCTQFGNCPVAVRPGFPPLIIVSRHCDKCLWPEITGGETTVSRSNAWTTCGVTRRY